MSENDDIILKLLELKPTRMVSENLLASRAYPFPPFILGFKNYLIKFEQEPFGGTCVFYIISSDQAIYDDSCEITEETYNKVIEYYKNISTNDLKKDIIKEHRRLKLNNINEVS